ncbi:50S ribosomal protein L32 [Patescibacteria group bacterium]|nr:50S ribosomal protein L32 [Patescibacteria group bacterium]
MTPLPKKKSTKARSAARKKALRIPGVVRCPSCKRLKEPHKACRYCGFYK